MNRDRQKDNRRDFIDIYNSYLENEQLVKYREQEIKEVEQHVKSTLRYQLGDLFVTSFKRPSLKTILFPISLSTLLWSYYKKPKREINLRLRTAAGSYLDTANNGNGKQSITFISTDLGDWMTDLAEIEALSKKYNVQLIFYCYHFQTLLSIHSKVKQLGVDVVFIYGTSFPQLFQSILDSLCKIRGNVVITNQRDIISVCFCFLANYHFGKHVYFHNVDPLVASRQATVHLQVTNQNLKEPSSHAWEPIVSTFLANYIKEGLNVPIDQVKEENLTNTLSETSHEFAEFFSEFYEAYREDQSDEMDH
ncbi:hypothetical protein BKP37_16515 [Anaerobacillus alkalilacustris]|uniref:Uncharacterized protein n=1 Tax=Anaerobacillus alkalilacustris TaxID=393763 RepID=A0A1S2LFV4_9BACI|nr:hypothetical protein [Anaerobacillus alkalilacustris]OIJ11246.1 hypothetical protein BKP37_16515 [Anaerobacillus alkalilacustris]